MQEYRAEGAGSAFGRRLDMGGGQQRGELEFFHTTQFKF